MVSVEAAVQETCVNMASKALSKAGSTRRRFRRGSSRAKAVQRLTAQVARQKKALRSIIGIGTSGFTGISREHDTYLDEEP